MRPTALALAAYLAAMALPARAADPIAPLLAVAVLLALLSPVPGSAAEAGGRPVHVYCSTGDHLWVGEREPVDSPATIDAMFEWMSDTYGVSCIYWRGGGTQIWDEDYQVGRQTPLAYDWATGWKRHLFRDLRINDAAVDSAHERGMQIILYTGLFEHGVQPDVGIMAPYLFEDRLRIEHPDWCPVDRWGQRRCPGPICFGYPEARRAVMDRYVRHLTDHGYDGICFYTYVENTGIRYLDEFGFNEPIIEEFGRLCPGVDLRRDTLTPEQRVQWHRARGRFVTDFLRELHEQLAPLHKTVTVILDSRDPDYPQPWWGKPIPGTGMIRLDWEAWIAEGIVDELWVQLGAVAEQQALLDRLLERCAGTDVRLVVRTAEPFAAHWDRYVAAGVTPVAVITAPRNGIERLTLQPTSPDALTSADWKLRAQTLADIAEGRLAADAGAVARLADDSHVLVRRRAMHALAALGDTRQVPTIEAGLDDPESSVRIAAADALRSLHGPDSPARIIEAVERDGYFQMKQSCVRALGATGQAGLAAAVGGLRSPHQPVREVCVRALYELGKAELAAEVIGPMLAAATDAGEDYRVRYWALDGLVGLRLTMSEADQRRLVAALLPIVQGEPDSTVQLHAAEALGHMAPLMTDDERQQAFDALVALLSQFGDGCAREDAAFGWRPVGNALLLFGDQGAGALEAMRTQTGDRWLAWIAYQVVGVPQRTRQMQLVSEAEAVAAHDRLAPPYPGTRSW
ncbi:MAG TPA: HEAT repeat domain-containing protein [Armatimonadota bacterium]|nr:HEAT repeat domain-containing protein [Armatimonadota bacterium]